MSTEAKKLDIGWADYLSHTNIVLSQDFNGEYRAKCWIGGILHTGPTMPSISSALLGLSALIDGWFFDCSYAHLEETVTEDDGDV